MSWSISIRKKAVFIIHWLFCTFSKIIIIKKKKPKTQNTTNKQQNLLSRVPVDWEHWSILCLGEQLLHTVQLLTLRPALWARLSHLVKHGLCPQSSADFRLNRKTCPMNIDSFPGPIIHSMVCWHFLCPWERMLISSRNFGSSLHILVSPPNSDLAHPQRRSNLESK